MFFSLKHVRKKTGNDTCLKYYVGSIGRAFVSRQKYPNPSAKFFVLYFIFIDGSVILEYLFGKYRNSKIFTVKKAINL